MTRSWWGWGTVEDALTDDEQSGAAALISARFGADAVTPVEPVDITSNLVAPPRVAVPDAISGLASFDHTDRVRHAHGQSFVDVTAAMEGRLSRFPDVVIRPSSRDEVRQVLDWCSGEGVNVVPFGGGSSVVGGVTTPDGPTAVMDLERLDGLLELDPVSRHAHIAGGTYGPAVEDLLRPHGLTLRHFPQSFEFSTLGGWVATRAGGHFATGPTHIDDVVASVGAITPTGEWRSRRLPGSGAGPSPDRLLLGSEGSLGVITDAWVRVRPRPVFRAQSTATFPNTAVGLDALRAIAQSGLQPSNCRLLDPVEAMLAGAGDGSATLLVLAFESADHPVADAMRRTNELVADHGGTPGEVKVVEGDETDTSEGAAKAWRQTFLRAPYLRDGLIRLGMVVETFETAITWDRVHDLVADLQAAVGEALQPLGGGSVSLRVTHAYPDGCAPYLTVIAPGRGRDRIAAWWDVKRAASEVLDAAGATITHHHAVGRDHAPWYVRQRPDPFARAMAAAKAELDPNGIMNPGVLGL